MSLRKTVMAAALSVVMLFSGCMLIPEKEKSESSEEPRPEQSSGSVSGESSASQTVSAPEPRRKSVELEKGEEYRLPFIGHALFYKSSDQLVAAVDSTGIVTAVSAGAAEITVSSDNVDIAVFSVTVTDENAVSSQPEESSAASENIITPAVWEAKAKNGAVVYMMGSIHVGDSDAQCLPDYFNAAFDLCDTLAVEIDPSDADMSVMRATLREYMYSDGTTIIDHVSAEAYTSARNILREHDLFYSSLDMYKPAIWINFLDDAVSMDAGLSGDYGVDDTVRALADARCKTIVGLEKNEDHISAYTEEDEELTELMLEEYVSEEYYDSSVEEIAGLYEKWKTGTLTAEDVTSDDSEIEELLKKAASDDELEELEHVIEMYESFTKRLVEDRNKLMTDRIEDFLKEKKAVMVVVGVAHFFGDNGIVSLLENRGYTVRRLSSEDVPALEALPKAA